MNFKAEFVWRNPTRSFAPKETLLYTAIWKQHPPILLNCIFVTYEKLFWKQVKLNLQSIQSIHQA